MEPDNAPLLEQYDNFDMIRFYRDIKNHLGRHIYDYNQAVLAAEQAGTPMPSLELPINRLLHSTLEIPAWQSSHAILHSVVTDHNCFESKDIWNMDSIALHGIGGNPPYKGHIVERIMELKGKI